MPVNEKYSPSPLWPQLGPAFYDAVEPARFPKALLRYRNQHWAERTGLGNLSESEWQKAFWAFEALPENLPQPLALRYHGHQFTHYNPDLGDGRGFVYAQLLDAPSRRKLDLGTKGSGQTPYSRRGDGRLTLKGAVREALATGFLEAVGVHTSKTFSVFETGEALERGDEPSPTRSAVLTRLSHSHVRIGTFQRLAYFNEKDNIQRLAEFCLKNYFPEASQDPAQATTQIFFEACRACAKTTAQWMLAGFVHGVLNTDNINITGESFDYGPYRFLPHYDTKFVAAYFDHSGLYAYGRQPYVLLWNLEQFARALGLDDSTTSEGAKIFQNQFTEETFRYFQKRLNITGSREAIENLFVATIHFLETSKAPFEAFFFDWFGGTMSESRAVTSARLSYYQGPAFQSFLHALQDVTSQDPALLQSTYFQRQEPIHLVIDEIERIWSLIDSRDDWSAFENKMRDFHLLRNIFKN